MELTELTTVEVQEFWEKCGWIFEHARYFTDGIRRWLPPISDIEFAPEGSVITLLNEPPTITLENLLKYAVPKLGYWSISQEKNKNVGAVAQILGTSKTMMDKDPATALFRAIQQVFKEER